MTSGLDSSAKPSVPNLYFYKSEVRDLPHFLHFTWLIDIIKILPVLFNTM